MCYTLMRGPSNHLVAITGIPKDIWPLVDPGWPLRDLLPQQCTSLWSGVLPNKFDSHRAFVSQVDLCMTFDPIGEVALKIRSQTS